MLLGVGKIRFGSTRSGFGLIGLDENSSELNPNLKPDPIRSEYNSDRTGSGFKFGLRLDEFSSNPINPKPDRVDPNPILPTPNALHLQLTCHIYLLMNNFSYTYDQYIIFTWFIKLTYHTFFETQNLGHLRSWSKFLNILNPNSSSKSK